MDYRVQLQRLETLLPYCLENKRRRREFIELAGRLPQGDLEWLLFQGYRMALMGQSETAHSYFLQGYFQCRRRELRSRFHWAILSLERAYPRPSDLDEMCQWLSGALHDGPAQALALRGGGLAREMAELAQWLRNPLLEGQSLREALQDILAGWRDVRLELELERAPSALERLFFRVFQELSENRQTLQPQQVHLWVKRHRQGWIGGWQDEIGRSCRMPTLRARVAQLGGRSLIKLQHGFLLKVAFPPRNQGSYL